LITKFIVLYWVISVISVWLVGKSGVHVRGACGHMLGRNIFANINVRNTGYSRYYKVPYEALY
jgi:hypothetical protein